MRVLRTIDSLGNKREFPLNLQEGEQISFGRLESCDISLPGESNLSRLHCYIRSSSGRVYIRDNASVNGVYCNGVSVVEAEMRPGVEFVLGLCTLVLAEHADSRQPKQKEATCTTEAVPEKVHSPNIPLREPLPVSAVASVHPQIQQAAPTAEPVPRTVKPAKKLHLRSTAAAPRQLVTAPPPAPKKKKQYRTRRIQTAAGTGTRRKRSRKLAATQQHWVETDSLPHSRSGSELGLPVGFNVSLGALVPHYPLHSEDAMALTVVSEEKCSIAVIQYDAMGEPSLIVPGSERERTVVYPNVLNRFPQASGADYELVTEAPFGPVQLVLLACTTPCKWNEIYNSALRSLNNPRPLPGKLEYAMITACPAAEIPPVWSSAILRLVTQP